MATLRPTAQSAAQLAIEKVLTERTLCHLDLFAANLLYGTDGMQRAGVGAAAASAAAEEEDLPDDVLMLLEQMDEKKQEHEHEQEPMMVKKTVQLGGGVESSE